MDFTVKYRPKCFSEVVGHREVVQVLKGNKDLRVVLFYGPSGVGKTTLARVYAMYVNCEKGDVEECRGSCRVCGQVVMGSGGDFLEENVGDARGIDDMRRLTDWLRYKPFSMRKRVLILDEVHMLTKPAQNLLLKVLEGVPEYALVMLCTTDVSGLIEPLRQRCFQFELKKVSEEELLTLANRVILNEVRERGVRVDTDELVQVVRSAVERSDGRPRKLLRFLQMWFDGGVREWSDVEGEEVYLYELFEGLVSEYDLGRFQRVWEVCQGEDEEKIVRVFESWVRKKLFGARDYVEVRVWVRVLEKFAGFWMSKISERNVVFWKVISACLEARRLLKEVGNGGEV